MQRESGNGPWAASAQAAAAMTGASGMARRAYRRFPSLPGGIRARPSHTSLFGDASCCLGLRAPRQLDPLEMLTHRPPRSQKPDADLGRAIRLGAVSSRQHPAGVQTLNESTESPVPFCQGSNPNSTPIRYQLESM